MIWIIAMILTIAIVMLASIFTTYAITRNTTNETIQQIVKIINESNTQIYEEDEENDLHCEDLDGFKKAYCEGKEVEILDESELLCKVIR